MCKIKAEDFAENYYQLPEKSITLFSTGSKNFQLINDHEILASGHLYDIVKTKISNGETLYYTYSDEEEDADVKQLTDWGKSNAEDKSMPTKTISLHLGKYFGIKKYSNSFLTEQLNLLRYGRLTNDLFLYISPLQHIFSPPPNNLFS